MFSYSNNILDINATEINCQVRNSNLAGKDANNEKQIHK